MMAPPAYWPSPAARQQCLSEASTTFRALRDWERHEAVRIAVLRYLNGGVEAPKGWTSTHPLALAVGEWWLAERARLLQVLG